LLSASLWPGGIPFGSSGGLLLVRLNADGTPDTSFGQGGTVLFGTLSKPFGSGLIWEVSVGVIVGADGKVVVAGLASGSPEPDGGLAVARLNPDGSLDTTFGTGGVQVTPFGTGNNHTLPLALAPGPDGSFVVEGYFYNSPAGWFGSGVLVFVEYQGD